MKYAITALAVALVVLIGVDVGWQQTRLQKRHQQSQLTRLLDLEQQIVPDRVRVVRLQSPSMTAPFEYVRRGETWRFPQYFDAYVYTDRMQALLEQLLLATGTQVADSGADHLRFGLDEAQATKVELLDASAQRLASIRLGQGIPGPSGEESYARLAGSDRVLHLHANPVRLLGRARPPLLDPHLLPRAETRAALVRVAVKRADRPYSLRRVLAPLPEDGPPMPMSEAERYRWVLEQEGRVDTCDDVSVRTWLMWLRSVRFEQLVAPDDPAYALGSAGVVELLDEKDVSDLLRLGRQASDDKTYVGNDVAGIVTTMPTGRAEWLLPPADVLRNPMPDPSPYESIP